MSDVSIERITYVDEAVMEAASRLSLQLDSSNQVTITEDYLETIILNPDSFWLMAKRNARFVGMASLFIMRMPTNVRSFLENVVVDEDSRGKGIGLALCSEAFAIADSQGANTLRTQAGTHNAASRAMLQKAGFKIEDYLDYYEINIHDGPRF
jgi:ribosomal protein S18 acetylase RimI-like enzyme